MRVCTIASGSSGNCIYVDGGGTGILIDAGVSRKKIVDGLSRIGVQPGRIDAIFVTHEHIDHIRGVNMMAKMFDVPLYATAGTLDAIIKKDEGGVISKSRIYEVRADKPVVLKGMEVLPFSISHDAADPVCYAVRAEGKKVGVATDLGEYDDYTVECLGGSDVLILEANHDISMLEAGSYPYSLKRRILGNKGHLSNEASGSLLGRLAGSRLKYVSLAHLSKENNYPKLAYSAVKCTLWEEHGIKDLPFELTVAKRDEPSAPIEI